jgi:hypothetical protein
MFMSYLPYMSVGLFSVCSVYDVPSACPSAFPAPMINIKNMCTVLLLTWITNVNLMKLFRSATVPLCDTIDVSRSRYV